MTHGSERRARNVHLTIRLTSIERTTIDDAAIQAGLTSGSFARQVLMGAPAPRQVRRPPVERAELARLLGELGRVGNNLNQLARAANTGDQVTGAELTSALHQLLPIRDAILAALGRRP